MTDNKIAILAEQLKQLKDDYKKGHAALLDEAKKAEIDPGALQRLVAWMRKNEFARLEQEVLDDQYRFLTGLRSTPATLPAEGELARAAALYAQKLTVRAVAEKSGHEHRRGPQAQGEGGGVQCSAGREHERRTRTGVSTDCEDQRRGGHRDGDFHARCHCQLTQARDARHWRASQPPQLATGNGGARQRRRPEGPVQYPDEGIKR